MFKSDEKDVTNVLKNFCTYLQNALDKTFNFQSGDVIHELPDEEYQNIIESLPSFSAETNLDLVNLWDTGMYFPKRKIYRKVSTVEIGNVARDPVCTKIAKQAGTMAPGILLFYCGEHQKCLGFTILSSAESCKIVTEIIITRFHIPPDVIIYDNACNLEDYVLNRFPNYFKNTKFFVDGFHFNAHSNCAQTYDSGMHKFMNVNTSLAEQKNSKLRHIKNTTPFMKARTFFSKIIYAIHKINKE